MEPIFFALATLAVLAAPGPTNTLLAASGASVGVRGSLRLMPAELGGYLVSITVLNTLSGPVIAQQPGAMLALKLAASLWLALCALGLWRESGSGFTAVNTPISFGRVFTTTLVNPKALVFAFGIFPQGPIIQRVPWLLGFCGLVGFAAIGWIGMGAMITRSAGPLATPRRVWRAAALGLAAFAMIFAGSAITAVY
jgi:threonine/homoserine/homoserine lactone efflux protein